MPHPDKGRFEYPCILAFLLAVAMTRATAGVKAQESVMPPCYPLTPEQAADATTLQEKILSDALLDSRTHPGRKVRWVKVQYFSHAWKDGAWYGIVKMAIPDPIPPGHEGLAAMCPSGSVHIQEGLDMDRDYFEATALELGIPVVSVPSMGKHYGLSEIHQMSDNLTMKFLKTGDPSWLAVYPCSAVRARALTMVGKLTGHPIRSAVHMGSSISAHQAWVWAAHDERVKGLVATGDIGFLRDMYPQDGSFRHKKRPMYEAVGKAGEEVQDLLVRHSDPYAFGDRLHCPVLQLVGTNDFASPLNTLPKFLDAIAGPTHLVFVPNYGHGCGTFRHLESFRMWIEHVLLERPLTRVDVVESVLSADGSLTCTARIAGKPKIRDVQLVYAGTSESGFLKSRNFPDTPKHNYIRTKWEAVPMAPAGERWSASVDLADTHKYVACFVDVTEEHGGRTGHASTSMFWLERR